MPDAKTADRPKLAAYQPAALKAMEYVVKQWELSPDDCTPEDILNPGYHANKATVLRRGHLILVRPKTGTWTGLFEVYASGDTWAKLRALWVTKHNQVNVEAPPDHRYKVDRNVNGWRVIHRETGRVMVEGLASKSEANEAMALEISKAA